MVPFLWDKMINHWVDQEPTTSAKMLLVITHACLQPVFFLPQSDCRADLIWCKWIQPFLPWYLGLMCSLSSIMKLVEEHRFRTKRPGGSHQNGTSYLFPSVTDLERASPCALKTELINPLTFSSGLCGDKIKEQEWERPSKTAKQHHARRARFTLELSFWDSLQT